LLDAIEAAPSAKGWGAGLARVELLILAQLGYGRDGPASIGPGESEQSWTEVIAALNRSGRLLEREILADRPAMLLDSRERLMDRLKRAAGNSLPASPVRPTSDS
jgi:DNA repair protein RecO (recombination protein O)